MLLFKTSMNTKKKNNNQSLRVTQRQDINSFLFVHVQVGYLLREDSPKRLKTGENDVNAGSVIVPDQVDFEPMDLVSSTQESMQQNYSGNSDDNELNKLDIASNISPTKVIDDSPLDLPIQSNSVRSVEQDLLAGINNYSLGDS